MAGRKPTDDSDWMEVYLINSYALFMGYLSMAVRGMGFLVLTWTTVVLLGGFVSVLEKKDFWCLTLITLVQIVGVFDVKRKEKLRYIWGSYNGSFYAVFGIVYAVFGKGDPPRSSKRRQIAVVLAVVLAFVQLVGFAAILFPLAALPLCGLLITTGISLWRLIENDYGNAANLKPALNVLYSLALFQGVLFCYRFGASHAGRTLADIVATKYGFTEEDPGRKSIEHYLRETKIECEKDPSFARGRNLITYAVGLMKPESSSHDYVSGVRILDKLLVQPELVGHHKLIKQLLIGSASSSHVFQKLLQALDSRRPHGPHGGEIRKLAARIVAHLADDIRLEQFPRGIHSISFLLDASQQQDNDSAPSTDYKELMVQGLLILEKLAADEDNCRAISNAQGLLSKVMAPVSSDVLHHMDHGAWSGVVVDASLQIMCRLVTACGETGTKLRGEISSNKKALSTMESIINCDQCNEQLHIRAMEILTQLSMATEIRESFIKKLRRVFADVKEGSDIRGLAGEKLAALSLKSKSDAVIVLQANGDVGDLTKILLEDESNKCRISAAGILEGLCIHCTDDVECVKKMNKTMTDAIIPKVLEAIFCCGLTGQKIQTGTEAHTVDISSTVTDIEGQDGITSSPQNIEQPEDMVHELQEAFLSLSTTIFDNLISADQDLAHQFVGGAAAFSFAGKLEEMVEGNSQPTVKCLRTMKLASKLAISMVRHGFVKVQDMQTFRQSLSKASKSEDMSDLDRVMFISSGNHSATNSDKTLASLVKEAQDLLGEKKEPLNKLALSSMETSN